MTLKKSVAQLVAGASVIALVAAVSVGVRAQQPPAAPAGGQGAGAGAARGGARGGGAANTGVAPGVFTAADANKDGVVTRAELMAALEKWYMDSDTAKAGSITQEQLLAALNTAMPAPPAPAGGGGRGAGQNQTPTAPTLAAMMAALPDKAPAKPAKPRHVLVLAKAAGFVHSSIPLAAATVKALGDKLGTWSTDISYDASVINTANLAKYDAVFLDSTTGCFLDEPGDKAATDARREALLAFVRGGKGLAGIHAASDSYHSRCPNDPQPAATAGARGGGGGRGAGGGANGTFATQIVTQADKNTDQKLSLVEMTSLANAWYDKLDTDKTGRVSSADFSTRFASALPQAVLVAAGGRGAGANTGAGGAPAVARGSGTQEVGSWPEFNHMIGGFFKFHWSGLHATVKIDDPKSPLTAMFGGKEFQITDETYTYAQDSFSRTNVHVLTSIDYDKMSDDDKAKEPAGTARMDGDYALSWIRAEGKGRVFYEAHGHSEAIYAITPMLQHVLAGLQYAIGDLKADDSPSVKPTAKKK